ncbi:protein ELC-like [Lycium barbarum]|uniref:protein ELC-like n=1 Tax=Lycium barbarum TaxID=112863 RepID=UPI00293E8CAE|nr:protein ELC-like [Lycium barbarum]
MMPPNSTQYPQQFLSTVLSQRGPSSLPYIEDVKWLIRQHLLQLLDSYPSLQPKTATFTHNDGRTVNLLQAEGTIPMVYQQVTYNIPVIIWLMESYPRHPPLVFVNPTRDIVIKHAHPFVNPSGVVGIPYLQNWVYPSSNLVELARNLSHFFGRDPPLYAKRPTNPNPSIHPPPSTSFSVGGSIRPVIPPRAFPQSPYGSGGGGGGTGRVMDDPSVVYKKNTIYKLVGSLHRDIIGLREARETDTDIIERDKLQEELIVIEARHLIKVNKMKEELIGLKSKQHFDLKKVLNLEEKLANTRMLLLIPWGIFIGFLAASLIN